VAAATRVGLDLADRWQREFDELVLRVGARFARVEPRRRVAGFLRGLLAGLPRTNCWTLAEHAGEHHPRGMQRLLSEAAWDTDGVRQDLLGYVVEHLGDPGAVLVIDETGDVKKGSSTVGVQRQYTGTAGRIENAQVAVYLTYAAPRGYALVDRALYLPQGWADDAARRAGAGIPAEVEFATKPALARDLIDRVLAGGTPAAWVAADEVYGADPRLRAAVASRGLGFVLAVAKSHHVTTGIGARRAIDLAVRLPGSAWHRLSAGPGAKGHRCYDWALVEADDPALTDSSSSHAHSRTDPATTSTTRAVTGLLVRRNIRTGEYAFYRVYAPRPVSLRELVRVAGVRWKIEESFAGGKELAALDEHQVRSWTSWHRWTLLAMLAHAFLSVLAATQPSPPSTPDPTASGSVAAPSALIPLTRNEIRRLFTHLRARIHSAQHHLQWSHWRRRHQADARASHYKRREAQIT
jgi:SRSO17 transposase